MLHQGYKLLYLLVLSHSFWNVAVANDTCGSNEKECVNPDSEDLAAVKFDLFVDDLLEYADFDDRQSIIFSDDGRHEVVATGNIRQYETIAVLRYSDMISPQSKYNEDLYCSTIQEFVRHLSMGRDSAYHHYVNYIMSQIDEKPSPLEAWGKNSMKLFGKLIGANLPPFEVALNFNTRFDFDARFNTPTWTAACGEEVHVELLPEGISKSEVIAAVVSRTLDQGYMLPFLDVYSHRSGDWANIQIYFDDDDEVAFVQSTRNIREGEKIHFSYDYVRRENELLAKEDKRSDTMETPDILLEYGFLEDYPQTFRFGDSILVTLDEDENGSVTTDIEMIKRQKVSYRLISFLQEEIYRLQQSSNQMEVWLSTGNYTDTSDEELSLMKNYASALTTALTGALDSFDEVNLDVESRLNVRDEDERFWIGGVVCANEDDKYMKFEEKYFAHESAHTSKYQYMCFYENPDVHDKCLDLETTVQICANYRPYYHEPFVHFPATLLPSPPKRVVFVGGGDSMLLHEVLKYPSIEKIVGLELDQVVVRQSFKHFFTQPHFDDPRVEWWFGDATKSLNVLPKEYFGSFDLVLIDLSETVMAFTVTKHLNVIEALALLAKPDGIVVKNEHYFTQFTEIFDHTVELTLRQNPVICDQHFSMGSNRVDFMKPNFKHVEGIETLLYRPLQNITDHVDMIKHYSRNNAITQGKCNKNEHEDELVKAGILLVIDAEEADAASDSIEELTKKLETTIGNEGLTILSTHSTPNEENGVFIVLVTKEAFISLRTWPGHKYCAIDLHFWGAFDKQVSLQKSLEQVIGTNKVSTYRVVVGGMIGSSTWETDKTTIGPLITNTRDCDPRPSREGYFDINALVEESYEIVHKKKGIVTVICADELQCTLLDSLKNIKVTAYPVVAKDDMESMLKKIALEKGPIGSMFIDSKVGSRYIKRLKDIVGRKENQRKFFSQSCMFVLPELDNKRLDFMNQLRVRTLSFQSQAVTVEIGEIGSMNKVGFFFFGDSNYFINLATVCEELERRMNLPVKIDKVDGMVTKPLFPFEPHNYNLEDYDGTPALDQFSRQVPLGSQSIFQLSFNSDNRKMSASSLYDAVEFAIRKMFDVKEINLVEEVGDGALIIALFKEGHFILSWDGAKRVDINIFTYNEDINHENSLIRSIQTKIPGLSVILLDEQPRGVERVVNFSKHLDEKRTPGCWDMYMWCKPFASEGACDGGERADFMQQYCHKSCGICE